MPFSQIFPPSPSPTESIRLFYTSVSHHSSKASILQCSAGFMIQLSHSYMTTGKTIALTRRTFVSKVMSLLFNMLSRIDMGFPGGSDGKESACDAGDLGLIPRLGRSPGGGMAIHSSVLAWRIPMDGEAWRATVHGILQPRILEWVAYPFSSRSS